MLVLVTGAAGFIGSSFARKLLSNGHKVVVLDKLTYAGHLGNISELIDNNHLHLKVGDISDEFYVKQLFNDFEFDAVVNFAAESHVDNSIHSPNEFIKTNVFGTFNLLERCRLYWQSQTSQKKNDFRFIQVSTDEVFGSLGKSGRFDENYPYSPNSPYSATKAGADHLARAWFHTYGLPTITTNCSNNYGPRQFPEKLIPLMIINALRGLKLPVYGTGENIRDWIHVEDHATGVYLALIKGTPGETYCFGGNSERRNMDVVKSICKILDEVRPSSELKSYLDLITFVQDRAGHDWRYAIDDSKAQRELGFKRKYDNFEEGLKDTISWYIANSDWTETVLAKARIKNKNEI